MDYVDPLRSQLYGSPPAPWLYHAESIPYVFFRNLERYQICRDLFRTEGTYRRKGTVLVCRHEDEPLLLYAGGKCFNEIVVNKGQYCSKIATKKNERLLRLDSINDQIDKLVLAGTSTWNTVSHVLASCSNNNLYHIRTYNRNEKNNEKNNDVETVSKYQVAGDICDITSACSTPWVNSSILCSGGEIFTWSPSEGVLLKSITLPLTENKESYRKSIESSLHPMLSYVSDRSTIYLCDYRSNSASVLVNMRHADVTALAQLSNKSDNFLVATSNKNLVLMDTRYVKHGLASKLLPDVCTTIKCMSGDDHPDVYATFNAESRQIWMHHIDNSLLGMSNHDDPSVRNSRLYWALLTGDSAAPACDTVKWSCNSFPVVDRSSITHSLWGVDLLPSPVSTNAEGARTYDALLVQQSAIGDVYIQKLRVDRDKNVPTVSALAPIQLSLPCGIRGNPATPASNIDSAAGDLADRADKMSQSIRHKSARKAKRNRDVVEEDLDENMTYPFSSGALIPAMTCDSHKPHVVAVDNFRAFVKPIFDSIACQDFRSECALMNKVEAEAMINQQNLELAIKEENDTPKCYYCPSGHRMLVRASNSIDCDSCKRRFDHGYSCYRKSCGYSLCFDCCIQIYICLHCSQQFRSIHLYNAHIRQCGYNFDSKYAGDTVVITNDAAKQIEALLQESRGVGITLGEIWSHLLTKVGLHTNVNDLRRHLLELSNVTEIILANPGSLHESKPFDGVIVRASGATLGLGQIDGHTETGDADVENTDNDGDHVDTTDELVTDVKRWCVGCYCVCCKYLFLRPSSYRKHCTRSKTHAIKLWNYNVKHGARQIFAKSKDMNLDNSLCSCSLDHGGPDSLRLCLRDNCLGIYMLCYTRRVSSDNSIPLLNELRTNWDDGVVRRRVSTEPE